MQQRHPIPFLSRFVVIFVAFISIAILVFQPSKLLASHSFTIYNKGEHRIISLYLSHVEDNDWGQDQLDGDVISPGQSQEFNMHDLCWYDIRAGYEHGVKRTINNVDTCSVDVSFYY
jgi:hypothetical protein